MGFDIQAWLRAKLIGKPSDKSTHGTSGGSTYLKPKGKTRKRLDEVDPWANRNMTDDPYGTRQMDEEPE